MLSNKNLNNGIVIFLMILIGLFIARTNTLGSFLLPSVIGGVSAVVVTKILIPAKEKINK